MSDERDYRKDCSDALEFPKNINNRPGLSNIQYRIGTYSDFREYMIRNLNKSDSLQAWTHRVSDDPGIALLEGASILGDILTFYQQLYANEAYLRSADWRESVSDLVRLLGYRLSPGVGGKATFALTFKGKDKVEVPSGFAIKADVVGLDEQAVFETTGKTTAYPDIGEFSLYPPSKLPKFNSAVTQFSIPTLTLTKADMTIEEKDRLMLIDKVSMATYNTQIVVVKKVETQFDRTTITIEGQWAKGNNLPQIYAFKLGRTFRHFGHNAPAKVIKVSGSSSSEVAISYNRNLHAATSNSGDTTIQPSFTYKQLPLDQQVEDLNIGSKVIIEGVTWHQAANVRTIKSIKTGSMTWGALTGATSILELDSGMEDNTHNYTHNTSDIRNMSVHETVGIQLTLKPPITVDYSTDLSRLYFYGDAKTYKLLNNRKAAFLDEKNEIFEQITLATESYSHATEKQKILRPVKITSDLWDEFSLSDFPLKDPTITVYGNLVDADQGGTQKEATLGNGDNRQAFQTFKLPKAPLTYHVSAGETPPEVPELKIYVDDRLWKQIPDFYGQKPDAEVYIVREDEKDDSWVQFGDGKTGRRLPSGLKNVTAKFRTGTGAYGALQEKKTPKAGSMLKGLDKVYLPDPDGASGGDDPETGDIAKEAAPGKIQSLDRLVSLKDFESEALGIAGVSRALAAWELEGNIPSVRLTVLMESGRQTELDVVKTTLQKYNRCRGPNRFPIEVIGGALDFVYIAVQVAYDVSYKQELVEDEIKEALGVNGDEDEGIDGSEGLFALKQRRFGENEYSTRIAGTIQNVEGVLWSKVTAFVSLCSYEFYGTVYFFCDGVDPENLYLPTSPMLKDTITCSNQRILSLYKDHLVLTAVSAPTEAC